MHKVLPFLSFLSYILIHGWLASPAYAQKPAYLRGMIPYHNVLTLPSPDGGRLTLTLAEHDKATPLRLDRWYYGYKAGQVHRTQGAYQGRLLHGPYEETYAGHALKERGTFRYGLKIGEWLYWDSTGTLRKVSHWRHGLENGRYRLYDEQGELAEQGYMRKGLKQGVVKRYMRTDSLLIEKQKYQAGQPVDGWKGSWGKRVLKRLQIKLHTKKPSHEGNETQPDPER